MAAMNVAQYDKAIHNDQKLTENSETEKSDEKDSARV